MDLDAFIEWEKKIIREERERLNKLERNSQNVEIDENICPAELLLKERKEKRENISCTKHAPLRINKGPAPEKNSYRSAFSSTSADKHTPITFSVPSSTNVQSQISVGKTNFKLSSSLSPALDAKQGSAAKLSNDTFSLYTSCSPERENENCSNIVARKINSGMISKTAKEVANQETAYAKKSVPFRDDGNKMAKIDTDMKGKDKDDMEQWVTDTFYSYFPGYNDELQKRQRYLRERQHENQQNFLKHQQAHPPLPKHALRKSKQAYQIDQTVNTARSSATSTSNSTNASTTMPHTTNKTDLEIIVNNPGYVPPKQHSARPNITRNKLLQDLRHTELSQIVGDNGVAERNRNNAEMETARKKDYQRELMEQIEEKRRSIELLREKDRHQEEALTRRLQEQLRTIRLEEQLEKEKLRAEKIRYDSEQNRLMRDQLLTKLQNDTRLLNSTTHSHKEIKLKNHNVPTSEADNFLGTATTVDVASTGDVENNNRVYKYFSNSARHEYRRGKPLPEDLVLDLGMQTLKSVRDDDELECFHLSEKMCPMCDAPLKSYENCCLRCQKKLSVRMKTNSNSNVEKELNISQEDSSEVDLSKESYSMICAKCERLYGLCATCLAQKEVCRACHRKRNVCLNCRRTLCSRCLDEIATGRDIERCHVNENTEIDRQKTNKADAESARSFEVIDVNYGVSPERNNNDAIEFVSPRRDLSYNSTDNNVDLTESPQRLPYSINIEKNSIFHPHYNPAQESATFNHLDIMPSDDQFNIERVRKETDKRLSRYLRNYGDLAVNPRARSRSDSGNDRSTQTTPHSVSRRDVVMHEEYNLSMPLLREMPKMTRTESDRMWLKKTTPKISNRILQLKQRWEVPAIQKFTISASSPKVLTQVGAIRKQLQAQHLVEDV